MAVGSARGGDAETLEALRARLEQLTRESALRQEQARQTGFRDGEAAVLSRTAPEVEKMMARLAATIEELASARRTMRRQMEEDLVRLATVIARRILHRELTVDPESLLGIVSAALERVHAREIVRISVYPRDAPVLEKYLASLGLPNRIEVVPDPALERGAVILETERGNLDGSIETQLEEIDRGFADLIRRRP